MAFFNRPILARTQILVPRWGPEQGYRRCFADGLNQSLGLIEKRPNIKMNVNVRL